MTYEELEYFRRREMQERAAAKKASNLHARRIHQQMAEVYAAIISSVALRDPLSSLRVRGAL
jgi:hypothetical protein